MCATPLQTVCVSLYVAFVLATLLLTIHFRSQGEEFGWRVCVPVPVPSSAEYGAVRLCEEVVGVHTAGQSAAWGAGLSLHYGWCVSDGSTLLVSIKIAEC